MTESPRPFRFGVSARSSWDPTPGAQLARTAEATGLLDAAARRPPHRHAPAAASRWRRRPRSPRRSGSARFVLNNDFHHPAWLAREVATLDALTGGRFELGMGAGHMKSEYDEVGLGVRPRPASGSTGWSSRSGLVQRLLAGETVTHAGAALPARRATGASRCRRRRCRC